MPKMRIFIKP